MTRKFTKPAKPAKPEPFLSMSEIRVDPHIVKTFESEVSVLMADGMEDKPIVVGLLICAMLHAAKTECLSPRQLGHAFNALMAYYCIWEDENE
jgi:hypothetical protein